jgi:hypothetical protein
MSALTAEGSDAAAAACNAAFEEASASSAGGGADPAMERVGVPRRLPPNLSKPSLEAEAEGLRRRLDALERRLASMEASGAGPKPA